MEPDNIFFRTPDTYFYGYEFAEFAAIGAFARLGKYLGNGLCYEAVAMIMLSMKDNQSVKIVHGYATAGNDSRGGHAWVEFRLNGEDWVASPSWFRDVALKKDIYYDEDVGICPEPVWTCSYKKFWNQPVSKKLHELTKKAETSYDILPMLRYYRPDDYSEPRTFGFFTDHESRGLHRFREWMLSGELRNYPASYRMPLTSRIVEEIGIKGLDFPSSEAQTETYELLHAFLNHHELP